MSLLRRLSALFALSAFVFPVACGGVGAEDEVDESGANATLGGTTEAFLKGLAAKPGSAERKKAGQILDEQLKATYAQFPVPSGEYDKPDYELTKKIFGFTVDYLKSEASAVCPAEKKIRVYRGYGAQIILHPKGQPNARLHLFGSFNSAIRADLKPAIDSAADPGEYAFENMANFTTATMETLPWKAFLGDRLVARTRDPEDKINLRWSQLASTHTVASDQSPLISTSLKASVADGFGPGVIVADVCPERAIPLASTFAFGETEMYVPFFLLPEEIVRVEGFECGLKIKRDGVKRETCFAEPFNDSDTRNALTQGYDACYTNFGFESEFKPFSYGRRSLETRFFDTKDVMYGVVERSKSIAEVRANAEVVKQKCAPDCDVAREVIATVKDQVAAGCGPNCDARDAANLETLAHDVTALEAKVNAECPKQ